MKALETIKKLTLKAVFALVAGTTILAAGSGCNTSGEYQAYEMANQMSPAFAKGISPFPTHMDSVYAGQAAVDTSEVTIDSQPGGLQAVDLLTR